MNLLLGAALLLASSAATNEGIYTSYPIFGDSEPVRYSDKRVSVITDKGLVRELIVQCSKDREGIVVHDYISEVFCDSKNACHGSLVTAINRTCGN